MSQQGVKPSGWHFDQARQQYYYFDQRTNMLVYQDGQRTTGRTQPSRRAYASQAGAPQMSQLSTGNPSGTYDFPYRTYARPEPSQTPFMGSTPQQAYDEQSTSRTVQSITPSTARDSREQTPSRTYEQNGVRVLEAKNPQTGIRTRLGTGPPELITDPTLFDSGVQAHSMLYGVGDGNSEPLFSSYRLRSGKFFTFGRVFSVLWTEPAGAGTRDNGEMMQSDRSISVGRFNERVFSRVRRFVVIRESGTYCSALPINTYNDRGVSMPGVVKSEHAIIYTGPEAPAALPQELPSRGELRTRPIPIRVTPDDRSERLDPHSRLHFDQIYTIQHNIKVKPFGMVHHDSMHALQSQFAEVWQSMRSATTALPIASNVSRTLTGTSARIPATRDMQSRHLPAATATQTHDSDYSDKPDDSDHDGEDDDKDDGHADVKTPSNTRTQRMREYISALIQQHGYSVAQALYNVVVLLQQQGQTREDAEVEARAYLHNVTTPAMSPVPRTPATIPRSLLAAQLQLQGQLRDESEDEDGDEDEDEDETAFPSAQRASVRNSVPKSRPHVIASDYEVTRFIEKRDELRKLFDRAENVCICRRLDGAKAKPQDIFTHFAITQRIIKEHQALVRELYTESHMILNSTAQIQDPNSNRELLDTAQSEATRFLEGLKTRGNFFATLILCELPPKSDAWRRFVNICVFTLKSASSTKHTALLDADMPFKYDVLMSHLGQEYSHLEAIYTRQHRFCAVRLQHSEQAYRNTSKELLRLPLLEKSKVNKGAFGKVFRVKVMAGYFSSEDRIFAMKKMKMNQQNIFEWGDAQWLFRQQPLKHESIMRAITSVRTPDRIYIFFPLAECDLRSYMDGNTPEGMQERLAHFKRLIGVAEALRYLHTQLRTREHERVLCIHEDLKAENILVVRSADGTICYQITDFGISSIITPDKHIDKKAMYTRVRRSLRDMGTRTILGNLMPNFAPEARDHGPVKASVDLWAFGVVLSEFVAWLSGGPAKLRDFEESRGGADRNGTEHTDDHYLSFEDDVLTGTTKVKKGIWMWFSELLTGADEEHSQFYSDCLLLLRDNLLVIDPDRRSKIEAVCVNLDTIYDRGRRVIWTHKHAKS